MSSGRLDWLMESVRTARADAWSMQQRSVEILLSVADTEEGLAATFNRLAEMGDARYRERRVAAADLARAAAVRARILAKPLERPQRG
jgi:hypothetical protein